MHVLSTLAQIGSGNLGMPPQASTYAADIDWTYAFTFWSCTVAFVIIMVAMIWFIWKYRHRPGYVQQGAPAHSTSLELFWSIIPTIIFLVIFYYGFTGFVDMATVPDYAYEIRVKSRKWSWDFVYPNGAVSSHLVVPKDTPVRLVLSSDDVIHSLFIPAFRTKKDVVPGRFNWTWFQAIANAPIRTEGVSADDKLLDKELGLDYFDLYCTEYCGTNHSMMRARVYVREPSVFQEWVTKQADILGTMPPAEGGKYLYTAKGCKQCHTVDGGAGNGPTWKDMFGYKQPLVGGGSVLADENYIRESILNPGAKLHEGYSNIMSSMQGNITEDEITAIIEYMKTLSDKGPKPMEAWPDAAETPAAAVE